MSAFSSHLIRQAGPADAAWIADFLRQRWNASTIVVHGESFDAVSLPALIADNLRIPTKPAMHSDLKPATHSETKPATVPI